MLELSAYEVEARRLSRTPTLVVQGRVNLEDMGAWLGRAYQTVFDRLVREHAAPVGPPFARYQGLNGAFDVEAGFAVAEGVAGQGEVVVSELPGGLAAVTWHIGPYEAMTPAYEALTGWITEQGGVPVGPPWECYYSDPQEQPDPVTWRTEIIQPYRLS